MMVTRCPACGTAFRVQPEQLEARAGHVRCGQCATVFDANTTLVTEPESAETAPGSAARLPDEEVTTVEKAVSRPLGASLPPAPEGSSADGDDDFEFGPAAKKRERILATLWSLGAALAAIALAGQVTYAYRGEIAALWPATRPWLAQACRQLRCVIPLPQHAELLSIESAELAAERGASGVLTLSAVLRNRAAFAQALPALELTLTDNAERALVRRILQPREYLGERAAAEPTLAPGSETAFRLHIDAGGLNAVGYRLFVLYL